MPSFANAKASLKGDENFPGQVDLNDDRLKSVTHQIKNLFASSKNPGTLRDWTKKKDGIVGTKYEKQLQDFIARGYGLYTIIREMKKCFGEQDVLRSRNILGYIKREILNKSDNLKLISQMNKHYSIDRIDSHEFLEKEALKRNKEIRDEEDELLNDIGQLKARIEILKNENKKYFNAGIESQITRNYEVIGALRQRLMILRAQKSGLMVDAEEMRLQMLNALTGIFLKVMLPKIPKDEKDGVLISLKQETQSWVNTETRLNKLEEFKKSLMSPKKATPFVIDMTKKK